MASRKRKLPTSSVISPKLKLSKKNKKLNADDDETNEVAVEETQRKEKEVGKNETYPTKKDKNEKSPTKSNKTAKKVINKKTANKGGKKRKATPTNTTSSDEEDKEEEKSPKGNAKKIKVSTEEISSSVSSQKKKTLVKNENKKQTNDESGFIPTALKEETDDEPFDSKIPQITRQMIQNSNKWVGAHVSISGGLYKAIEEACSLQANALGLFLRSQRRWESPPLVQDSIDKFEKTIKEKKFGCSAAARINSEASSEYFDSIKEQILPHGSYLINLGNPDKAKRDKSYSVFLDDLKRCDALNIALYNFHPGSTCGDTTIDKSVAFIAEGINNAHKETKQVKIVIENMAGQGNVIGSKFEELAAIIKLVHDQTRVGVCLDTCHLFAAGYDVRTAEAWENTLKEFDRIVGMQYLSALHLNDSKGQLGCNKDRHECIGKGYIGMDCFKFIMKDSRFCNMPLILETPDEKLWFKEIQLLHSFIQPSAKK